MLINKAMVQAQIFKPRLRKVRQLLHRQGVEILLVSASGSGELQTKPPLMMLDPESRRIR